MRYVLTIVEVKVVPFISVTEKMLIRIFLKFKNTNQLEHERLLII